MLNSRCTVVTIVIPTDERAFMAWYPGLTQAVKEGVQTFSVRAAMHGRTSLTILSPFSAGRSQTR